MLALDLGYGWVKSMFDDKIDTFPNALGTPDPVRFRPDVLGNRASFPITVANEEDSERHSFFVGIPAIKQSRHTWSHVARKRYAWEIRALLAESVYRHHQESIDIPLLVSGLPVAWYAEDQNEHREALIGTTLYRHGQDEDWNTINVQRVAIIPQPVGTLLYIAFGHKDKEVLSEGFRAGIIDIGHFTTDCVVTEGGDYLAPRSFSVPLGISRLHDDVRQIARQLYTLELDMRGADSAVRNNCVRVRGEEKELPVDGAKEALANEIIDNILGVWGDALDLDKIIVTGGGAHLLLDYIIESYPQSTTVDNPENANVLGYNVYGKALEKV